MYIRLMLFEVVLYACSTVAGIIFLIHLGLAIGVIIDRFRDFRFPSGSENQCRISVIVVAKDEEHTLPRLLESLEAQSRPDFEIILVNDRSTDHTGELMNRYKERLGSRVTIIHNDQEPEFLNGKQCALDIALAVAGGELLMFTDGDCVLPPTWVADYPRYFKDPKVGVVFGQISLLGNASFLERYQAFDQPLIHQYSSGSAGLGLPTGCFGNNLVARKIALDQIGGFKALGYTLTEDAALISAVAENKWKVRVSTLPSTMIATIPQGSWRQFINQHVRWNSGAFYSGDFATRWGYRFIVLYLLASILVIPFAPFQPLLLILPVVSFISIGTLSLTMGLLYRRDRIQDLLRLAPYTLFFMLFYSLITLLSIIRFSPVWKGKQQDLGASKKSI
ncbi:MAG TPA: glycosyltransferase [bacterium]|nr:glycosyltransferase [bacterium]